MITNVVGAAVDGLLSGSEEVTMTVHLEEDAASRSPEKSEVYKFQLTVLIGL